jgi:MFS transporter, DHA1 family, tetracycline resistance protein
MYSKNLLIIYAFLTLDIIVGTVTWTFFPVFLTGLPNQVFLMSLTFVASTLMQMIFSPILGTASDIVGRKPAFIISTVGTSLAQLFLLPIKPVGLFLNRLSDGSTNGIYATVRSSITDSVPSDQVQKYIGLAETISSFGIVIGPATAAILIYFVDGTPLMQARAVVTAAVAISLISLVLSFLFKETHVNKNHRKLNRREIFQLVGKNANILTLYHRIQAVWHENQRIGMLIVIQILLASSMGMYGYLIAYSSAGPLQLSPKILSYFMLYLGILMSVVNTAFFGYIIKKVNTHRVALFSLAVLPITSLLYGSIHTQVWMLFAVAALDIITGAYIFGLIGGFTAEEIDEKRRGEIFGLTQAGSAFASFFTTVVFSVLALVHPKLPFVWFSLGFAGAAYLYFKWMKAHAK